MDRAKFTKIALNLPETEQGGHMGATDFRLRKKIFATLTAEDLAGFKLTPETQGLLLERVAGSHKASGAWGDRGWTKAPLANLDESAAIFALGEAWRTCASKRQLLLLDGPAAN